MLERIGYDEVDIAGERTDLAELVGQEQPDLLLLNDDDLAYAQDPPRRALARAPPSSLPRGFQDSLPRSLVLGATWDMTRDARDAGPRLRALRARLAAGRDRLDAAARPARPGRRRPTRLYTAPEHRAETAGAALVVAARARRVGRARQRRPVPARRGLGGHDVATPPTSRACAPCSRAPSPFAGLTVDTELRWTFVKALAALGVADDVEIQTELDRDPTATGKERPPRRWPPVPPPRPRPTPGPRPSSATTCPTRWSRRSAPASGAAATCPCSSRTSRSTTRCSSTRGPRAASPSASASSAASTRSPREPAAQGRLGRVARGQRRRGARPRAHRRREPRHHRPRPRRRRSATASG